MANDRIVQVNGVHSDADLLRAEIKLLHELEVKLAHDPVAIETKIKEGLQTAAKKAESSLRKTAGGLKKGLGERKQNRKERVNSAGGGSHCEADDIFAIDD